MTRIEQVHFGGDTLVVVSQGGMDYDPASQVTGIDFLWEFEE